MPKKVALITGSGRQRVGYVIAKALAQEGYAIVVHYHNSADQAERNVTELQSLGVEAIALRADVGDEADVKRLVEQTLERFGRIDVLVTTSSIWNPIPLEEVTAEDMLKNFEVNTLGTFFCAKYAGLAMCKQAEGGAIITIGDWTIDRPFANFAPYLIAKGAIPTLTRTMAVELAAKNPKVRVNCIHPGPVMFPPDATEEEKQSRIDSTLVQTANCPETVAHAVKFLIENKFVTGACLPVDGGRHIAGNQHE